jgi:cell division septation protein DedD
MKALRRAGGQAVGLLAVALLLIARAPERLAAQSDPRLLGAVQLYQAGRQDSARAVVRKLLQTLPPTDSVYPQALYTAGLLAADPQTVQTDLQRVVIEYGQSSWADGALLRLAQFYWAQGDPASAVQAVERLRRDYPNSPLEARADLIAAQAYFNLKDEPSGCARLRAALASAGADVEFKNQLAFYLPRCPAVTPPVGSGATPPPDSATAPPAAASYAVQVLAVKSATQVDDMLTRLKVMGFDARVVRDTSGFFKVRVGRYATREEAVRAQTRLKTRIGGQPFVVEEP